ncbi:helix-turn-helix transcriptional regulator [Weissella confusa]|uniref:helix-turn-helix transcriptional regulator n=1 Tax=Weissella confusa TaxID=1583 RepID=UPI0013DFDFBA|nr:WYL domain-containing protein [Weissella confusa]MBJ7659728.1 WYL domain-containing protein [Weissella confusa]QIE77770.1 WYL domain-containing protein [Weissella confusa]
MSKDNIDRPLRLALKLLSGESIIPENWAEENNVTDRSVQRDFKILRETLADTQYPAELIANKTTKSISLYRKNTFDSSAALTLAKLVLASRAFTEREMTRLIKSILDMMSSEEAEQIRVTLRNEQLAYTPVTHQKDLIKLIWDISGWIQAQQSVAFTYTNAKDEERHLFGLPTGLLFDSYYFYVIIHFQATENHAERDAYYRLDRFTEIKAESRHIKYPYNQRLEEGKIRQTNNLMQIGRTIQVEFDYTGLVSAALDKFPNAKIKRKGTDGIPTRITIPAVTDSGFKMWALSQGARVTVISPVSLRESLVAEINQMLNQYNA